MEFIEGPTMSEVVHKAPPSLDQALACTMRILEILAVGQALPLQHRDLEPDNVMIRGGDWSDPVLLRRHPVRPRTRMHRNHWHRAQRQYQPRTAISQPFEPVHGSAPDIAGEGRCQPHRADLVCLNDARTPGEHEAAAAVLTAIETILAKGRSTLTLDMGGTATTAQLGTAISQERSASRPRR
jgi:serine/threonine protein kinase